jgi:hypothetical protein
VSQTVGEAQPFGQEGQQDVHPKDSRLLLAHNDRPGGVRGPDSQDWEVWLSHLLLEPETGQG